MDAPSTRRFFKKSATGAASPIPMTRRTDAALVSDHGGSAVGRAVRRAPRLRAHMRWLAACRRSRTRGLLLGNALRRHRGELVDLEPALESALSGIVAEAGDDPTVMVIGDADLLKVAGGTAAESSPDVVVVGVSPADDLAARMPEARSRAARPAGWI